MKGPIVKPQRHQRSRAKGAKLPAGVICVTRPGKWGNPYLTAHDFRCAFLAIRDGRMLSPERQKHFEHMATIVRDIEVLRGKDLACWCKPGQSCHADHLIEFANREG